jgi:eukaryotic-like serine/threonine-protein kinase
VGFLSFLFGGKGRKKRLKVANVSQRFDMRGRTGQGSMSKVHQAYDRDLGRTVCLKILDKKKTADFEARFKNPGAVKPSEGEICMQLHHRNIVQTYEHGLTTKGEPYLVMEWIEGEGMNFLVETKSPKLAANRFNYLIQLATGIDYLHATRFLHRDICPRNVMINKEGVVKLIDFGLTVPYSPEFTKPGNRTGTADYLAPELIKRQTTDHRIDLFALGVTAWEVFLGGFPWERATETIETLRRRINTKPRDPRELKPDLSDAMARFLSKSVDMDREKRFPTAAAFRDALKALGVDQGQKVTAPEEE